MAGDGSRRRPAGQQAPKRGGAWYRYWERFGRQEIDEPVKDQRGDTRRRFREQRVDEPVEERRARRRRSS
jgi:hypothetical protein